MVGIKHFYAPLPVDTPSLSLHGIGVREPMRPGIVDRSTGTQDYFLLLMHDAGQLADGEGIRTVKADTLIVWSPRDGHTYGRPESRWSHSWMHCKGRLIQRWLRDAELPTNVAIPDSNAALVDEHLTAIDAEATQHTPADETIIGNLIENLIVHLGRALRRPHTPIAPEPLRLARQHIESRYDRPLRLEDLADLSYLSVPHFCAEFKRWFGMPAIDYAIHLRMQRAAYLLRDRNLAIKEIARRVGYADPFHFSKLFKKHFECSPRVYRNRLGGG